MKVRKGPPLQPKKQHTSAPDTQQHEPAPPPSTSVAPLSSDVAANLANAEPGAGTKGVQTRTAQMTKSSAEKFLADPRLQSVGASLREEARDAVDFWAGQTDLVITTVGEIGDTVGDSVVAAGAKLDELADVGREKLQSAVDELRERAKKMLLQVDATKEGEQTWAAAKLLESVADKLQELIQLDSAKAFLARGGSALFKITSDLVELVGEIAHAGAKGLAVGITMCGRFLKWLVGKDTLRSTGVTFYAGVRANCVSQKLNAGVGGGVYFPSFNERDPQDRDQSYFDVVAFDWGYSAASPVVGAGWNSRGGAGAGINLYFVSATFNDMTERVFIGIPGVWGVTLGRDKERGSEINFGNAVGLAGGEKLGAYFSYGIALHTPLLDPVNKYVTRPIAKVIVSLSNTVWTALKWTWHQVKPPNVGDLAKDPSTKAPTRGADAPGDP